MAARGNEIVKRGKTAYGWSIICLQHRVFISSRPLVGACQEAEDIFSTIEDELKALDYQGELPQDHVTALREIKDIFNTTVIGLCCLNLKIGLLIDGVVI